MQPQRYGEEGEQRGGGSVCSFFHSKHRVKMDEARKMQQQQGEKKRENGFSLCFFFIAPLNTEQHPQRPPIRSQASELAIQWGAGT